MAHRLAALAMLLAAPAAFAQNPGPAATLSADVARLWTDGSQHILLRGNAYFLHGDLRVRADEILVLAPAAPPAEGEHVRLELFARGEVRVERPGHPAEELSRYEQQYLAKGFAVNAQDRRDNAPAFDHPLVVAARQSGGDPGVVRAELVAPQAPGNAPTPAIVRTQFSTPAAPIPGQARRGGGAGRVIAPSRDPNARRVLSLAPRGARGFSVSFGQYTESGERLDTISGGVVITIEEPDTGNLATLVTDRAAIWRRPKDNAPAPPAPSLAGGTDVSNDAVRVYLEGNVQVNLGNLRNLGRGNQVQFNAKQAFFDAENNRAMALDGYVETYDDRLRAPLLMKAERLYMFGSEKFFGEGAAFTTSAHRGLPGYEFDAKEAYLTMSQRPLVNPFTGEQILDAAGAPRQRRKNLATGYSNVLRVDGLPVFFLPKLKADLDHPLGAVQAVRFGNTQRLGFGAAVTLDLWYLLGLDYLPAAERSNWQGEIGYYSERGLAGGTRLDYAGAEPLGTPGAYQGRALAWFLHDQGQDFLGLGRNGIVPDTQNRGRVLFQHRHEFENDFTLLAGFAHLSDRNFLQSFFQNDYDVAPDQETYLYLKQQRGPWAWSVLAQPRNNAFLPQTEALPRGDLWWLGQSLLEERLTYFGHTSAGYYRVRPPEGAAAVGLPAFDADVRTARVDTRHELDAPFRLGDLNVVPYAVGQFTGYSKDYAGDGVGRFLGGAGVRTSLPFWKVFPSVRSDLLNLNGLAHKVNLTADYWWGHASTSRANLPYIDQLDDDSSDLVRRMNLIRDFTANGLPIPARRDPRFEAFRRDLAAYPDALDSLHVVRAGVEQRWQTKRGPEGAERIIDWAVFDAHASWFPQSGRDNFGKPWGMLDASSKLHLGDRTSILASGAYEPFDGTALGNIGLMMQRPPRQTMTLFASHYTSGPFRSNFIGGAGSYRFSEKYAAAASAAVDVEQFSRISWQAGVTRVGLDFLTTVSIVYNASRGDFGFQFDILPKVAQAASRTRNMALTLPFGVEAGEPIVPLQPTALGSLPQYATPSPF